MNNFHTTNPNFSNYNKGIYLTSADIIENRNNELPTLMTEYNDNSKISRYNKLNLPKINKTKIKDYTNEFSDSEIIYTNFHSSFSPENFYDYGESCNKFYPKMDKTLKDGLCPRNIILKTRKYNEEERKIISDLKKDEMIQRSIGQGMHMRIQGYRTLNKREPFKLILSKLEAGKIYDKSDFENKKIEIKENEIEDNKNKDNIIKDGYHMIKNRKSIKPKIYHLYKEKKKRTEKFVKRRSSLLNRPLNELIRDDKPPSFIDKESMSLIKNMKNRNRDYEVLHALEKCGEIDLKYYLGL